MKGSGKSDFKCSQCGALLAASKLNDVGKKCDTCGTTHCFVKTNQRGRSFTDRLDLNTKGAVKSKSK